MTDIIDNAFEMLTQTPSDINEHLPTLKKYAQECDHITEFGVRWVVSTFAFVAAKPKKIVSVDLIDPRNLPASEKHWDNFNCGARLSTIIDYCAQSEIDFNFILGDTTTIEIEDTDLIFMDTLHDYDQLKKELTLHGNKSRKYLIFHDTLSHKFRNESNPYVIGTSINDKIGIYPAIHEFLLENPHWYIHEVYTNCSGLTILKTNS